MAIHTRKFSKEDILKMALVTIFNQLFSGKDGEITGEEEEDGNFTIYFTEKAEFLS